MCKGATTLRIMTINIMTFSVMINASLKITIIFIESYKPRVIIFSVAFSLLSRVSQSQQQTKISIMKSIVTLRISEIQHNNAKLKVNGLLCSAQLCSALLNSAQLCSALLSSAQLCSALLSSAQLCPALLW
jgi:hypothetical protein